MVPATNKHMRRGRLRKAAYLLLAFTLFIPLLSVGGGQASAAAASWPLIDGNGVNGINQNIRIHANYPKIAVFKNEVYAAWVESNGTATLIRVKKYNGAGWESIDGIGLNVNPNKNANNPTMTVFNGKLYLAWEELNPNSQIKVKSYDGFGWTEVVEGNGLNITAEKAATVPALVVFDNALYAAWQESNDAGILQIRVKKYEGNKSWTSLDGAGQTGLNWNAAAGGSFPAMAVFQESLYITWMESNGTSVQIRVKRYDGNTSWTSVDGNTATGLNMVNSYSGNKPAMAALNDSLVVIWEEAPVGTNDRKIRAKKYDGTRWESAEGSSANGLNRYNELQVREPALLALNNELYATWQEVKIGTGIYQIRVRKYDGGEWTFVDGGGNDGLNKNVGEAATEPAIAAGNNELFVTWQEKSPEAGKYDQIRVAKYIVPAVRSVTLNLASASVVQGGIRQLSATVDAVGGATPTVTWSSNGVDQKVTVDGTGKVSVAADAVPGDYTITATSVFDASKQGTATITVTPAPAVHSVSIDPSTASVMQGESEQLSASVDAVGGAATTVTWSSNGVAQKVTVDGAGKVSAAADAVPGDYTITATSVFDASKKGTATITVTIAPAVHSVSVDPSTASVMQGESEQLSASVVAAGGADETVTWSSDDGGGRVTVDNTGNVTVASDAIPGVYTITATSVFDASKKGTATITVTAAPAIHSVSVDPSAASIMQGESKQLSASVVAAGGADETVTWSSEDGGGQVTVDNTGNVTAAPETIPGIYTITATSAFDASKQGTAIITVTEAHSYSIAPIADQTLTPLTLGYESGTQESRPVSIANTGTGALASLSVTLSGANASDFAVTPPDSALDGGASTSFELAVKDGLPANTYTATVTVTADRLASVSFVVTQAVHLPNAPANPQDLVALGGDRLATLGWSPVPNATQYRVYMAADPNPSDFAEVATVTSATYGAFNLVNGTTYYFVVKSENPGGLSAASNLVAVTPSVVPGTPTEVTAVAGNGRATIAFTVPSETGGSPITGYEVIISPGNAVVAGGSSPITVTGLTNGVSYTFTVIAINSAGRSAASGQSNAIVPTAPPVDNGGTSPSQSQPSAPAEPSVTDETGVDILVNGKVENAGVAKVSERGDRTVMTVAVDQKKLSDKLAAEGQHAVVTIPIGKKFDIVVAELNGQMIKNMEDKQAVLEFKTDYATYTLPASQIRIDSIFAQAGQSAALQDLKVWIEIAVPTEDKLKVAENAAAQGRFELVARPLSFTVSVVYGEKTVEVAAFDVYVERTIALPQGIDPNKITTGVVVEPDGTVRHVPTKVRQIDGKYEAQINSVTNSLYAVVWHPLEFGDVEKHWAKEAVNDMGSRMIVDGTGNGMFAPDREITRAEFAAIVVRGLGLKPETGATPFLDVKSEDWYSSAVHTAYAHRLISGMGDGTFRPNDKVTREQAMLILSKAMAITALKEKLPERSTDAALRPFEDAASVASWALSGVADNLQAGVVSGRAENVLAPKGYMTRAETATMIRRLLQKSDLI